MILERLSILSLLLLFAVCVLGCLDGAQRGKHAVLGTMTTVLDNTDGLVTVLSGVSLPAAEEKSSGPLLYCLAIGPNVTHSGEQHAPYTSSFKLTSGDNTALLSWHRGRDTVSISGNTFDRTEGIGFAVVFSADDAEVFQVELSDTDAVDLDSALVRFKKALPQVVELKNAVVHETIAP